MLTLVVVRLDNCLNRNCRERRFVTDTPPRSVLLRSLGACRDFDGGIISRDDAIRIIYSELPHHPNFEGASEVEMPHVVVDFHDCVLYIGNIKRSNRVEVGFGARMSSIDWPNEETRAIFAV